MVLTFVGRQYRNHGHGTANTYRQGGREDAFGRRDFRFRRQSNHRSRQPPPRTLRTDSEPSQPKIPAEFFTLTRKHFIVVKSIHHRECLRGGLPPSLIKKRNILASSVNPAFKNDYFTSAVDSITAQWCDSVHRALCDHYNELIDDAIKYISSTSMPTSLLDTSIKMVVKWARRQLGNKLRDSELDEALSLIYLHQKQLHESCHVPPTAPTAFEGSTGTSHTTSDHCNHTLPPVSEVSQLSTSVLEICDVGTQTSTSSNRRSDRRTSSTPCEVSTQTNENVVSSFCASTQVQTDLALNDEDPGPVSDLVDLDADPGGLPSANRNLTQTRLQGFTTNQPSTNYTSSQTAGSLDFSKSRIIIGDDNLRNLECDDACVLATRRGRLSYFKYLLQAIKDVHLEVTHFMCCLSLLDSKNKPTSNFTVFRAIIYNAKRLFPNAHISVFLNGVPDDIQDEFLNNIIDLNDLITNRKPSCCKVIKAPDDFVSIDGVWSDLWKERAYERIKNFL